MKGKMKQWISGLLVLAMVFTSSGMTAFAQEVDSMITEEQTEIETPAKKTRNVSGEAAPVAEVVPTGLDTLSGEGTYDSPYLISTEEDLRVLSEIGISKNVSGYYRLEQDITLTEEWVPIGISSSYAFKGYFDGNNKTIHNLSISENQNLKGLFGYNKGSVENLTVDGTITGNGTSGILAGENAGTISNCHVSGNVESSGNHGGLLGVNTASGIIELSDASVEVTGTGTSGGFVGVNNGTIRYSGAAGNVSGSNGNTGGFVGLSEEGSAKIENCYAKGKVSGNTAGGFAGRNAYSGVIRYAYATGMVNDNDGAGFVASTYSADQMFFCYYDNANKGNKLGIPMTLTQMKDSDNYTGFDFENVWTIEEGGYPYINYNGQDESVSIEGNGDIDDPYIIRTQEQLIALAKGILSYKALKYYQLGNDITLTSLNWTPIGGTGTGGFCGHFDGKGYTISGLNISGQGSVYTGLFGLNKGTIQNLTVSGDVESTGKAGVLTGENAGKIINCHVSGTVKSAENHGGLAGHNTSSGEIKESTADVKVTGSGTSGGFVGLNNGTVKYSGASGDVSGSNGNTGGFVGLSEDGTANIENCYALGDVSGATAGGFAGRNAYSGVIRYAYATGMVADNKGAGFVASTYSTDQMYFCYYNSANTGNKLGIPMTLAQMKEADNYTGFDFENIWMIEAGRYPVISLSGEAGNVQIEGDGSEEHPYVIENEKQLIALSKGALSFTAKVYYQLANDIVITKANWTPIGGTGTNGFQGVFDGQGYTISGLNISGQGNVRTGLFGLNKGTIQNLTVSGDVESTGKAGMLTGENAGKIINCHVSGTVKSTENHGGLAGHNTSSGEIKESTADVKVTGSGTSGGFVGLNNGTVKYSGASGDVSGSNGNTGGFVGLSEDGTANIENCYALGDVSGATAGGFAGRNAYSGAIRYAYATGMVADNKGAGFVASTYSTDQMYFCYYNGANTGNRMGIPCTKAQLKQEKYYTGFDFEHIWKLEESYPVIALNGNVEPVEIEGEGTQDNPYIVTNEEQLLAMAKRELPIKGKYFYKLANDIMLTSPNWTPIGGNGGSEFSGEFDGQGFTISGLQIYGRNEASTGLFGVNAGTIKNLTVSGDVEAANDAGILIGKNNGTVENCSSTGVCESDGFHGGLVGNNSGTVCSSSSSATVCGRGTRGGLAGYNNNNINTSMATGKVTGSEGYAGGFVGLNEAHVENCYARGTVSGATAGGFAGRSAYGTTKNCYSTGKTNEGSGGGFTGSRYSANLENCYYCTDTSFCTDTGKGDGLSRTQMRSSINYVNWDFTEVWGIYETINDGFPFLLTELEITESEEKSFWYDVKENRKGYAAIEEEMTIWLQEEADCTVDFKVVYSIEGKIENTTIAGSYDEGKSAFKANFHISGNMEEISSITAIVTDSNGVETTVNFKGSFDNQMPLSVEGKIKIAVSDEISNTKDMYLTLTNTAGSKIYTYNMDGSKSREVNGLAEDTYCAVLYANGEEFAKQENIIVKAGRVIDADFTNIPLIANVEVEFYADNQKIDDKTLSVNFYDNTEGKNRTFKKGTSLNYLAAGDQIKYSVNFSHEIKKWYREDKTLYEVTLNPGLNIIRVELDAFKKTEITVDVTDEVSGEAAEAVTVVLSQKYNNTHTHQVTGITDSQGMCTLEVIDEPATITYTKRGYETTEVLYSFDEMEKGIHESIATNKGMIEFDVTSKENVRMDETTMEYSVYPDKVILKRASSSKSQNVDMYYWPVAYVNGSDWSVGEEFTAYVEAKGYSQKEAAVATVNEYGNLTFSIELLKQGDLEIHATWNKGFGTDINTYALYDENGIRQKYTSSQNADVMMNNIPAGTYTLVGADKVVGLSKYNTLEELQANENITSHYAIEEDVEIKDGFIIETDMIIPTVTDSTTLLNESGSSLTSNNTYALIGDNIHIRAQYAFNEAEVKEKKLILNIPEGTSLQKESVTVNGKQRTVTEAEDGTFSITAAEDEVLVRYSVKVLSTVSVSELAFEGKVTYKKQTKTYTELLGRVVVSVNEITVKAPAQTNYTDISVHGVAPKNTLVKVYDDGILVGQITSNKYGAYRADITLLDKGRNKVHKIVAKCENAEGVIQESESVKIRYGSNIATLTQFEVRCNAHDYTVYTVKNPTQGIGNITFTYNPAYPVTFVADFDDTSAVTGVSTIINLTNGNTIEVPMIYNRSYDYYEATIKMHYSDVPIGFDVSFMPIKFSVEEREELEIGFTENVEQIKTESTEDVYVCEKELKLNDAGKTKVRSYTKIEKVGLFIPGADSNYELIEVEGKKVYLDNSIIELDYNGTLYEVYQSYVELDDGSYARYTEGLGFYGTGTLPASSARISMGGIRDAKSAYDYIDTINSYSDMENDGDYSQSSELDFLEEIASEMEKSPDPKIRQKAAEVRANLEYAKLADKMNWAYDSCNEVADKDSADSLDWLWKQVTKKQKKATDAMKDMNNMHYNDWLNQCYELIFADDEVWDYLNEEGSFWDKLKWKKYREKYAASDAKTILDPSGYVYETFEDNRVEGVTAELYFENDEGYMEFWDAEEYNQINPQKTDTEGKYGWDVPEGLWQVYYSKEGYEDTKSDKLVVPPPQLDVNVEMVATSGASIQKQNCKYNRVTLEFDKYLLVDSIKAADVKITKGDTNYSVSVEIANANIRTYKNQNVVKMVDLVLSKGTFDDGEYVVDIAKGVQTYAGYASNAMTTQFVSVSSGEDESYTITIPDKVTVTRGDEVLSDGAVINRNDRLLITAKPGDLEELSYLTVNGEAFASGEYYTVKKENLILDVGFKGIVTTYKVVFDAQGGSAVPSYDSVVAGEKIEKPVDSVKACGKLSGWYTDEACMNAWDFENDVVNSNMILYAKWEVEHQYKEQVLINAGCSNVGVAVYICENNDHSYAEVLPELGHDDGKEYITKATAAKNGSIVKKCTRCEKQLSKSTIYYPKSVNLSAATYTYDGNAKKPTVKVYDTNGKVISAANYTVSYASGRKNVGKYKVTVKFKGTKYTGTKTAEFVINPKGTTISSVTAAKKAFTVKWKKQAAKMALSRINGYEIRYSTSSAMKSAKTVTAGTTYSTVSKKVTGLSAKKTYYIQVRTYQKVNGVKYYSPWSKSKSIKTK